MNTSIKMLEEMNENGGTILQPEAELEERKHVLQIIKAFRYYHKYAHARLHSTRCYLNNLPQRHQQWLTKYRSHLDSIRDCIDKNQAVIKQMLSSDLPLTNANGTSSDICTGSTTEDMNLDGHTMQLCTRDHEKVQTTLKLIARDWSAAGSEERNQSYKPIIDAIEEFYNSNEYDTNEVKILVPGAGLGRLTYELACRGYECEGNEFSYFMIFASNFVLNQCTDVNNYTLYPWIHQYVNNLRMCDQISGISFPDVCPIQNPPKGNISMAAGDFLEVYRVPNTYDCVATCFFIDCANNVVDFIETIYKILVPGGIWVNLGPLLYHYSDIAGEGSIEPTYENLVFIIEMVGFQLLRSDTGIHTKYAQNPRSMLKSEYESLFWIARKPLTNKNPHDHEQNYKIMDDDSDSSATEVITRKNGNNNGTYIEHSTT